MPKVSIAIPIHDSPLLGFFLTRLLNSITTQTFRDYEIVITNEGAMAKNHNAAIRKCKGEIVKLMQYDDYFADEHALQKIVDNFKEGDWWMITGYKHDVEGKVVDARLPKWNEDILLGMNTLGGVSSLVFRNSDPLLFDENLSWLVDCDLYHRYYKKYALPKFLNEHVVVVDGRSDRLTHQLGADLKANETGYLIEKYDVGIIEPMFRMMKKTPSDINEHLDTLKAYALKCSHITEMGVRGMVSTWAFLSGLLPSHGKYVGVDTVNPAEHGTHLEEVEEICRKEQVGFEFRLGSSLELDIEPTDFLFLDTIHTKEQVSQELSRHASKVRKYIGFHDTESCPEIKEAIAEFLEGIPWKIVVDDKHNNGLMIIERNE